MKALVTIGGYAVPVAEWCEESGQGVALVEERRLTVFGDLDRSKSRIGLFAWCPRRPASSAKIYWDDPRRLEDWLVANVDRFDKLRLRAVMTHLRTW